MFDTPRQLSYNLDMWRGKSYYRHQAERVCNNRVHDLKNYNRPSWFMYFPFHTHIQYNQPHRYHKIHALATRVPRWKRHPYDDDIRYRRRRKSGFRSKVDEKFLLREGYLDDSQDSNEIICF